MPQAASNPARFCLPLVEGLEPSQDTRTAWLHFPHSSAAAGSHSRTVNHFKTARWQPGLHQRLSLWPKRESSRCKSARARPTRLLLKFFWQTPGKPATARYQAPPADLFSPRPVSSDLRSPSSNKLKRRLRRAPRNNGIGRCFAFFVSSSQPCTSAMTRNFFQNVCKSSPHPRNCRRNFWSLQSSTPWLSRRFRYHAIIVEL